MEFFPIFNMKNQNILLIILLYSINMHLIYSQMENPTDLYVGGIFSSNHKQQELAFTTGITEANNILKMNSLHNKYRLVALPMTTDQFNSFLASQQTCKLISKKVITVLGPTDFTSSDEIYSICRTFGIPFLDMSPVKIAPDVEPLKINLYPHYSNITNCIKEYITAMNWRRLVIIYFESRELVKFAGLLNKFDKQVLLKKISFDGTEKYLLKELKSQNFNHFIVDIPYWYFSDFMQLADAYNMTSQYYGYLLTNWDTQLLDLKNQTFNTAANISTLALFPIEKQKTTDRQMLKFQTHIFELETAKHNAQIFSMLTTETAMIYRSMRLLALSVVEVSRSSHIVLSSFLSCEAKNAWEVGISLFNAFTLARDTNPKGPGNGFSINENGWIDNYVISISRIQNQFYFEDFGYWTKDFGLKITRKSMSKEEVSYELSKQTLRVITIIDSPYVISLKKDANGKTLKDPSAWSGFCIELLKKISEDLKFNYTIEEVHDREYGSFKVDEDGEKWSGLVGDLIAHKADLAMSSLTITYDRERVLDFTTPYMNLGISIIYKRPPQTEIKLWAFLKPLSQSVWGYVIMSYISVSFVLFVIGRFSPYEWYNQSPCQTDNPYHSNQFNILNSMWFTIGSFMQQGTDIIPKATSTRIVAGMWWFFTLIIISSYTANLAAFLTLARMKVPIENAEDLSKQFKIKYGTVRGGSTFTFFEKSKLPTYQKMHKFMKNNPSYLVNGNVEGIQKVQEMNYAYILESTTNEFYTRRRCDLVRIGGLLDSKGYGIGLPQGSRYRDAITESILKLEKAQEIEKLRRFFWRDYNNTASCPPAEDSSPTSSLGIKETGGVFVMLGTGALGSVVLALVEMFIKAHRRANVKKTPYCEEVKLIINENFKKMCDHGDEEEDEEEGEEENEDDESVDRSSGIDFHRLGGQGGEIAAAEANVGDEDNNQGYMSSSSDIVLQQRASAASGNKSQHNAPHITHTHGKSKYAPNHITNTPQLGSFSVGSIDNPLSLNALVDSVGSPIYPGGLSSQPLPLPNHPPIDYNQLMMFRDACQAAPINTDGRGGATLVGGPSSQILSPPQIPTEPNSSFDNLSMASNAFTQQQQQQQQQHVRVKKVAC